MIWVNPTYAEAEMLKKIQICKYENNLKAFDHFEKKFIPVYPERTTVRYCIDATFSVPFEGQNFPVGYHHKDSFSFCMPASSAAPLPF